MKKFIGNPIRVEVKLRDVSNSITSWDQLEAIYLIFYTNEYKQELSFAYPTKEGHSTMQREGNSLFFTVRDFQTRKLKEDLLMLKVIVDPQNGITERISYRKVFTGITMINP